MKTFLAMILIAGMVAAQGSRPKGYDWVPVTMWVAAPPISVKARRKAPEARQRVRPKARPIWPHSILLEPQQLLAEARRLPPEKDVAVESAKGVGKITRGVGKLFKKVL